MSNTVTVTASPWYASSGFWNGVILAASGLVVGFPTEAGNDGVAALFALFASGNAIREALRGKTVDLKAWITNKNTWNYIGATIIAIFPMIPADLFTRLCYTSCLRSRLRPNRRPERPAKESFCFVFLPFRLCRRGFFSIKIHL